MKLMNAKVSLSNPADDYFDEVLVENIADRNCFSYTDNDGFLCEMCVYEGDDHMLELHLKTDYYAKITALEGVCKIDVTVVDFKYHSDILEMHYLINDEERLIKINYC